jgi:hypothetical protein
MLSKPYEVFTPKKMQKMVYAAGKLVYGITQPPDLLSSLQFCLRGGVEFSASVSATILKTSIK